MIYTCDLSEWLELGETCDFDEMRTAQFDKATRLLVAEVPIMKKKEQRKVVQWDSSVIDNETHGKVRTDDEYWDPDKPSSDDDDSSGEEEAKRKAKRREPARETTEGALEGAHYEVPIEDYTFVRYEDHEENFRYMPPKLDRWRSQEGISFELIVDGLVSRCHLL